MTDDDPDAANTDEGEDDLAKCIGGNAVVDHESEERPCNQANCAGPHERQVRHLESAKHQTDHQNHKIIDTEECLDGCQVFLFVIGGRKQIERRGRSAGGEKAIADTTDDAQNTTGCDSRLYVYFAREEKEKDRYRKE